MKEYTCECGTDCLVGSFEDEEKDGKCWGQVRVIDEIDCGNGEYSWTYACEGHMDYFETGKYRPMENV